MPCYVDNAQIAFRRMRSCHMIADSLEELHAMAERLGMRREWLQTNVRCPHYDIASYKRKEAVRLGAIPLDRIEFVRVMRRVGPVLIRELRLEAGDEQVPEVG